MHPSFESLHVWHDARSLVKKIYASSGAPLDQSLRDQIRRAALSVMSNIAEGHERGSAREFARFLKIAKGSCGEVRSQLYAAEDIGQMGREKAAELRTDAAMLSRRITALIASMREVSRATDGK
jgi:four helix bundle protein